MDAGNIRKLYIFFWRHPVLDWENARTTELYRELTYDDDLRIHMRHNIDYRFMNVHRQTESYIKDRDVIEFFRRHKIRREPLCYIELWKPNEENRKEEFWSIDSDYRLKVLLNRIKFHLNTPV